MADGIEPWASAELYTRAVRLGTRRERRDLARALEDLVSRARAGRQGRPYRRLRKRRPTSAYPALRRTAVLAHSAALLELAARIEGPTPVPVSVVARLMLLCCERSSPIFTAGRPVDGLDAIVTESVDRLLRSAQPPRPQSADSDTRGS